MSAEETWQLSTDAAVAYERDFVPAVFAQWPPVIADLVGIAASDRVLDVACGTGVLAREAAARVGPSGRVTGLDINEGMLAVARRLRPEIDWRQGDAMALPFPDGSFDVAASQLAFMFFPDPVAALREMWRVLAPGGRLAVAVPRTIEHAEGYRVLAGLLRQEAGEEAAAMVEGYFALGDETTLKRHAEAAGLEGVEVVVREGWARFDSIDEALRIEIQGSPMTALVDDAAYRRVAAKAREALQPFCGGGGRVALSLDSSILVARKP